MSGSGLACLNRRRCGHRLPRFGQTAGLIVTDEPPAGVDFLTVLLNDIAIDPAAKIGVVADNFCAQDVFSPFTQHLGDAFHTELRPDRLKRHIDIADLAGIPRSVEPDGGHRETGMIVEKHWQQDGLAFGALAKLVH